MTKPNDPQATPRTDAVIRDYDSEGFLRTAGALQDLSHQLERELAQKTAEVAEEALATAEACKQLNQKTAEVEALKAEINESEYETPPEDVQEWLWHLQFHLTEHDLPHAGKALRAAYPAVRDWFTDQYTSMKVWRRRAKRAEKENAQLKQEVERMRSDGYIVSTALLQSGKDPGSLDDEERAAIDAFVPYRKTTPKAE